MFVYTSRCTRSNEISCWIDVQEIAVYRQTNQHLTVLITTFERWQR